MTLLWVYTRSHRSTVVVVVNMQRVALGVWLSGGRQARVDRLKNCLAPATT